jgi:hypothetical protein
VLNCHTHRQTYTQAQHRAQSNRTITSTYAHSISPRWILHDHLSHDYHMIMFPLQGLGCAKRSTQFPSPSWSVSKMCNAIMMRTFTCVRIQVYELRRRMTFTSQYGRKSSQWKVLQRKCRKGSGTDNSEFSTVVSASRRILNIMLPASEKQSESKLLFLSFHSVPFIRLLQHSICPSTIRNVPLGGAIPSRL